MLKHSCARNIRYLGVVAMVLGGVVFSGSLAGATVTPAEPVMSDSLLVDPGVTPITSRRESPVVIESNTPEDDDQIDRPSASDLTGSDRLQVLEANAIYANTGAAVSSPSMNHDLMKFLEENPVDFVSPHDRQWRMAQEIQFLEENTVLPGAPDSAEWKGTLHEYQFIEENTMLPGASDSAEWKGTLHEYQFLEENGLILTTIPVVRESNSMFINDTYQDHLYP